MGLDFEGRFATIRQAAPSAVSEFRAEAAQGRDELHSLRRHLRDLELERDAFLRRHKLTRTARSATGGSLTLKVGVLLALFVFEVFLNGFFLAKGSELGYLGGSVEAFTFALLNVGVSFLIGAVGVREGVPFSARARDARSHATPRASRVAARAPPCSRRSP